VRWHAVVGPNTVPEIYGGGRLEDTIVKMAQTVRLTDLPVTILEDVFLELNLADLAACRRVGFR
jgi:hypothetical protein